MIKSFIKRWKLIIKEDYRKFIFMLVLLVIAARINTLAGRYTSSSGWALAPDIILDIIPAINLEFIFVYVWLGIIFFLFLYTVLIKPKKTLEVLFHWSLLLIVIATFIILTHLKTPIEAAPMVFPTLFKGLRFTNDLFFSGHTALPLVGFFVFRESKIRYFFLASSLLMGFTVLATHQHYSIDVFAAFFIAYGTFKLGQHIMKKLGWLKQKH